MEPKMTSFPKVSRWTALAASTEVRGYRAQLAADLANNASAQVLAVDKANLASSTRRLTVQAGRLDTIV
jgi:hypothetical protein